MTRKRRIERLPELLNTGAAALPTFARGFGSFPEPIGEWRNKPADPGDQPAITGLYFALMADESLNLIGSRDRLLIEGQYAEAAIFIGALTALRPEQKVFISNAHDVPSGALHLIQPALAPASALAEVEPLDVDFSAFARQSREHAAGGSA
jgi:hypothetical protein